MFRFKILSKSMAILQRVSIHPMFRFKCSDGLLLELRLLVSIHPMFRFKTSRPSLWILSMVTFQYILCFGSSNCNYDLNLIRVWFQYILCFGSSSITKLVERLFKEFQYILCFGSRKHLLIY